VEYLLSNIIEYLYAVGPLVVFVVAGIETAFFVGLLVPAEATVLLAAFLAAEGVFTLKAVLAATILGALAGDQAGYALGRFGGTRYAARGGRVGRLWARYEPRATAMFRRRTIVAVSLARFVSFVRTLMPWFAGMTRMPWPRFLFFDILGVIGWGGASVAAGYLAGESWEALAAWLGRATAVILVSIAGVLGTVIVLRRRRALAAEAVPAQSPAADPATASEPVDR
jgi:membrane protein DedA with SNARE-associated domain